MYSECTVSERAVATVTDCVVASIRYVYDYTVNERAVATVTDFVVKSVRYIYSEYTVRKRAVATVYTDSSIYNSVSWRLNDMYTEYTVCERAVAKITDCVVASTRYVYGVYS